MILSLGACKIKSESGEKTAEEKREELEKIEKTIFEDEVITKEYKNSAGTVTEKISVTLPLIKKTSDCKGKEKINEALYEFEKSVETSAELNAENIGEDMKTFGHESALNIVYGYELAEYTEEYVSVVMKGYRKFGEIGEDDEPTYTAFAFSRETGERITLETFIGTNKDKKQAALDAVIAYSNENYSPNGYEITDEIKDLLTAYFDESNIVICDEGIKFVYSYNQLSGGSLKGVYYAFVQWDKVNA